MRRQLNKKAMAIAEHMPALRTLKLYGNPLTNVGLQAILDGCPHLESLDVCKCCNLNIGGNFGKGIVNRLNIFLRLSCACCVFVETCHHDWPSFEDYLYFVSILQVTTFHLAFLEMISDTMILK